jgi:hypothetical protein
MSDNFHFGRYQVGLSNVGSYQVSGRPYIKTLIQVPDTGANTTAAEVVLPSVSKFVTVRNDGGGAAGQLGEIKVSFSRNGLNPEEANFVMLQPSASFSADMRVTKLYLMASGAADDQYATVIAGLTNIPFSSLTSSWSGLDGVG